MESETKEGKKELIRWEKAAKVSVIALLCLAPIDLFAATSGGLTTLNTTIGNIKTALSAIGVAVITMAIMWAGYKLAFAHSSLHDIAKPFLGAILVGCAAAIAGYIIEGTIS